MYYSGFDILVVILTFPSRMDFCSDSEIGTGNKTEIGTAKCFFFYLKIHCTLLFGEAVPVSPVLSCNVYLKSI